MAMLSNPRLLLIDEFSLGLSPTMVETLTEAVQELRRRFRISVLFVEQNAAFATRLSDSIYVMENGRIVLEGPTNEIQDNSQFRDFYLGMTDNSKRRSYREVSQYSKRIRWFG
jgi:branched-chain amino acid transport system ATP-binding protein